MGEATTSKIWNWQKKKKKTIQWILWTCEFVNIPCFLTFWRILNLYLVHCHYCCLYRIRKLESLRWKQTLLIAHTFPIRTGWQNVSKYQNRDPRREILATLFWHIDKAVRRGCRMIYGSASPTTKYSPWLILHTTDVCIVRASINIIVVRKALHKTTRHTSSARVTHLSPCVVRLSGYIPLYVNLELSATRTGGQSMSCLDYSRYPHYYCT